MTARLVIKHSGQNEIIEIPENVSKQLQIWQLPRLTEWKLEYRLGGGRRKRSRRQRAVRVSEARSHLYCFRARLNGENILSNKRTLAGYSVITNPSV